MKSSNLWIATAIAFSGTAQAQEPQVSARHAPTVSVAQPIGCYSNTAASLGSTFNAGFATKSDEGCIDRSGEARAAYCAPALREFTDARYEARCAGLSARDLTLALFS